MSNYEVKTESEIKGTKKAEPKKPTFWSKFFDIVLTVFLILSIGVSACVIFINVRYTSCFVSGMSMFPTFNATGFNSLGEYLDPYNASESTQDGSKVDFLLCDEKDYLDDLKRFDIVCTYYSDDYVGGSLKSNCSPKIKRLVGMPGEYVFLVTSQTDENKYCGDLYISTDSNLSSADLGLVPTKLIEDGYDILQVSQPLPASTYDSKIKITKGEEAKYNYGNVISYSYHWHLGEDQYLVLGDNRASSYSKDSRYVGPISKSYLQGKIVCGLGLGKISNNGSSCKFDFFTLNWRTF